MFLRDPKWNLKRMPYCWIDRLKFRRISTNPKSMCNLWSLQPTSIFFTSVRQMILKFMWLNDCLDLLFCFVAKSYLALCDPMICSRPGSSVHDTSQARILEWVAISFSGDLLHPGIEPMSPVLAGRFFTTETLGKSV